MYHEEIYSFDIDTVSTNILKPLNVIVGLINALLFTYIAVRYSECMLLSEVQLIRAYTLYKLVQNLPVEDIEQDAILTYLRDIPRILLTGDAN